MLITWWENKCVYEERLLRGSQLSESRCENLPALANDVIHRSRRASTRRTLCFNDLHRLCARRRRRSLTRLYVCVLEDVSVRLEMRRPQDSVEVERRILGPLFSLQGRPIWRQRIKESAHVTQTMDEIRIAHLPCLAFCRDVAAPSLSAVLQQRSPNSQKDGHVDDGPDLLVVV